jgi:23S rRNA (cytidine1920-2'-O)/16S rRNA (cytidine1409-2'-O)-methyltransferase
MRGKKIPRLLLLQQRYPRIEKKALYAKIVAGSYKVNGETLRDPQCQVPYNSDIEEQKKKYVSRGGQKLEYALLTWGIDVKDKIFVDAGASTGGFSDCLLQSGAGLVHAVDVGYNLLDYTLRMNERIIVHERSNIMGIDALEPCPHAAVADLSFRSILNVPTHLFELTSEKWAILLVKPQFEYNTGTGDIPGDFSGVLRDTDTIAHVLREVVTGLWERSVFASKLCRSPISGRKGNTEFLVFVASKPEISLEQLLLLAEQAVSQDTQS